MCDERERLIGYVYDECAPGERQAIEDHLAGCPTCREEIGGLRRVRQDLLAWDVPQHDPIWRPLTPRPVASVWQQVPAWAMAAAAGVMLTVGAAGGAATSYVFFPQRPPQVAQAPAPAATPVVASTPAPVTSADLRALEARVLEKLRSEIEEGDNRVRLVATHGQNGTADVDIDAVATQVASRLQSDQTKFKLDILSAVNADVRSVYRRIDKTEGLARNIALNVPQR